MARDTFGNKDQLKSLFGAVAQSMAAPMTSDEVQEIKDAFDQVLLSKNFIKTSHYDVARWLRFDPTNHKGLVIKAGTTIEFADGIGKRFDVDTKIDLTDQLGLAGTDYFLFMNSSGLVTAVTDKSEGVGKYFGRFHTLCVNAGTMTMISPASPSSGITVGSKYLVKPYNQDRDPDFYAFYNKTVTVVSAGTPYDVITTEHPLSGYLAGDILPESVMCTSWYPNCRFDDAMVYDVTTNIFADVYLQSGTGVNTRSKYNQTYTTSRRSENFISDVSFVGKRLLNSSEFSSVSLGSNECTNIAGTAKVSVTGGHSDTAGKRMISAIGCEECCGLCWDLLSDTMAKTTTSWDNGDGKGSFGQVYGDPNILVGGGSWSDAAKCGSRSFYTAITNSQVADYVACRGCADLATNGVSEIRDTSGGSNGDTGANKVHYSTEEQVIGTWIDGKPLYQRTFTGTINNTTSARHWITLLVASAISDTGIVIVVPLSYFMDRDNSIFPISFSTRVVNDGGVASALKDGSSGELRICLAGIGVGDIPYVITIQYTKITD